MTNNVSLSKDSVSHELIVRGGYRSDDGQVFDLVVNAYENGASMPLDQCPHSMEQIVAIIQSTWKKCMESSKGGTLDLNNARSFSSNGQRTVKIGIPNGDAESEKPLTPMRELISFFCPFRTFTTTMSSAIFSVRVEAPVVADSTRRSTPPAALPPVSGTASVAVTPIIAIPTTSPRSVDRPAEAVIPPPAVNPKRALRPTVAISSSPSVPSFDEWLQQEVRKIVFPQGRQDFEARREQLRKELMNRTGSHKTIIASIKKIIIEATQRKQGVSQAWAVRGLFADELGGDQQEIIESLK